MDPTVTRTGTEAGADGWSAFFAAELARVPLVLILRGLCTQDAVATARTAWQAGVRLVEVTLETDHGLPALEAVVDAAPDGIAVGAGTLTTPERLAMAADAGARFGVAPGLDTDTVLAAERRGIPFLPGIATPTEAGQALRLGVSTVKAFPASTLGPGWVAALAGPFPTLRVIATGGVTAASAPAFLDAGALGVGVGKSLADGDLPAFVAELSSRAPDPRE